MNVYSGWPNANKHSIPIPVVRQVIERDKGICQTCGKAGIFVTRFGNPAVVENPKNIPIKQDDTNNSRDLIKFELHHKKPRFLGGTNEADNLVLLCRDCNRSQTYMKLLIQEAQRRELLE